jgi:Mrp family chromosome partitioning ATPase
MSEENVLQQENSKGGVKTGYVVFIAVLAAVIAGALLPAKARMVDMLWIVSISVTAAVVLTSIIGRDGGELGGLTILVHCCAIFHILAAVATARLIIKYNTAGDVVEFFGSLASLGSALTIIIVVSAGAVAGVILSAVAVGAASRKAKKFIDETAAFKIVGVETDLNTGIIDYKTAEELKDKIISQIQFHRNIRADFKSLSWDIAVGGCTIAVVIIVLLVQAGLEADARTEAMGIFSELITGYVIVVVCLMLAITVSIACLLAKTSGIKGEKLEPESEKINLYEKEKKDAEQVELLNPDFAEVAKKHNLDEMEHSVSEPDSEQNKEDEQEGWFEDLDEQQKEVADQFEEISELDNIEVKKEENSQKDQLSQKQAEPATAEPPAAAEEEEEEEEEESEEEKQGLPDEQESQKIEDGPEKMQEEQTEQQEVDLPAIIPIGEVFGSLDEYYNELCETVRKVPYSMGPVLFAAENFDQLPVTVVVNTAARLAQAGLKTVIIDADPERDALSTVFEIDKTEAEGQALESCIKGLYVSCRDGFVNKNASDLAEMFKEVSRGFDCGIIYAPNMNSRPDPVQLIHSVNTAVIFSDKYIDDDNIYNLAISSQCRVIAVMLPPDSAAPSE